MDDVIRTTKVEDGRVYDITIQDVEPYLKEAHYERSIAPDAKSQNKYKFNRMGLVKACTIPFGLIEQMMRGQCCVEGVSYNPLSSDPDECRRAYLHVQTCHKEVLTVNGTPFARKRNKWQ